MSNFQEIAEELQYRVKSAINLKDNNHLSELVGILRENKWPENAINELLTNLMNEDWWSDLSAQQQAQYIKDHPKSQKAQDAKEKEKKEPSEEPSEKPNDEPDEEPTEEPVEKEESEKDILSRLDKEGKSQRKHIMGRLDLDEYKRNNPDATEEEIKHLEDLKKDMDEYTHPDITPERKQELAKQMKEKYGLATNRPTTDKDGNPQKVKLYIKKNHDGGKVPRSMEKLLCTKSGNANDSQKLLVDDLNDNGGEVKPNDIGGKNERVVSQEFETAAKPSFKTPSRKKHRRLAPKGARRIKDDKTGEYYYLDKDGNKKPFYKKDPTVSKIFDGDNALADLEDKEPGKETYHSLEGPTSEDGEIIPSNTPEGQNKHLDWIINENESNQRIKDKCDEYINHPDTSEADKAKFKKIKSGIENYEKEMNKIKNMPPGPEKAKKVKELNAKLIDDIYNSHPDIAAGMGKQLAENALVTEELANGEECYMPSAGNFPGGDKIKVIKDESGIEMVAGVSVKYGRSNPETQIHGFPAQADSMSRFAEPTQNEGESDEDFKERKKEIRTRSATNVGQKGYVNGVRDDIVDDPKKQEEMINKSGMDKAITDKKEFHTINKEIKDEIERFLDEFPGDRKNAEIALQKHIKKWMKDNGIQERLEKCIDRKEFSKQLTGTEDGTYVDENGKTKKHSSKRLADKSDPMETLAIITLGATIKEGNGNPSLDYNHQRYENGEYHSGTVGPSHGDDMMNLANYGMSSRMYRTSGRTGGTILSTGTGEYGRKITKKGK